MENRIYKMKEKLLGKIEEEMQDMNRLDVKEVGELINAVHHLAETEYYCSVADAMWAGKHGYGDSSAPITSMRHGYVETPVRSMEPHWSGSMGYDGEIVDKIGEMARNMSREDKMVMKNKILTKLSEF